MINIITDDNSRRLDAFHLLCLLFDREKDIELRFSFKQEGDLIRCVGKLQIESTDHNLHACISIARHKSEKSAKNAALGKAILDACGQSLPYGYSVGVRPVKVPLFYLKSGIPDNEIESFLVSDYGMSPRNAEILSALAKEERMLEKTVDKRDICLYISIPFCPTRCSYCSFISSAAPKHLKLLPEYTRLICEELDYFGNVLENSNRRVRAIYMGGGTPSTLSPEQFTSVFSTLAKYSVFNNVDEITVECGRPDTVSEDKLRVLRDYGVSRICINPQTTDDHVLKTIGRNHTTADFFSSYALARKLGFQTINCDLIAGLPSDTLEGFKKSVEDILSLSPENITVHTFSAKKSATLTTEHITNQTVATTEWVDFARFSCINSGYLPYYLYRQKNTQSSLENIGYSLPKHTCLYNQLMMEDMCSIVSVGAGGISKLFCEQDDHLKIVRVAADKYPFEYFADQDKQKEHLKRIAEFLLR